MGDEKWIWNGREYFVLEFDPMTGVIRRQVVAPVQGFERRMRDTGRTLFFFWFMQAGAQVAIVLTSRIFLGWVPFEKLAVPFFIVFVVGPVLVGVYWFLRRKRKIELARRILLS